MDDDLLQNLLLLETDVDGAMKRFSSNAALYTSLLIEFPKDETMNSLIKALQDENWDAAYTAAHALKGLAGNMGFVPLFHASGELVLLIRKGKIDDVADTFKKVKKSYTNIVDVINGMDENILKRERQ